MERKIRNIADIGISEGWAEPPQLGPERRSILSLTGGNRAKTMDSKDHRISNWVSLQ